MRELSVAVTVVGICIFTAGCGGGSDERLTSTTTPSLAPTTASTTASPVAEPALDGLLLSPAEIDTATGATGMTVVATSTSLANDINVPPDSPEDRIACVGIVGTAEAQAYAGSDSTAVRDQFLQSSGGDGTQRSTGQSVVLFPSAGQAVAFFDTSAEKWPTCRQFTMGDSRYTVGPVSNTDGTLSTSLTRENPNAPASMCERALTVTNNVAVDVSTCGTNLPDSAVKIASQITARIPAQ